MANPLPTTSTIAVIGTGVMGPGIAQIAAAAGHTVKLFHPRTEAVDKAIDGIRRAFAKLVDKGKMSAEAAHAAGERLHAAGSLHELAGCALVIEAIVENLEVKRGLFAELESIVGDDCILATNTSSLSVTSIGAALRVPTRLVGMHFFNPAPLMALVEVVHGLETDSAVADVVSATAAAWGKSPVHAKSTPGFIVNRVARPYYGEALRLLTEQAAEPATIDAVMREAGGFRMGPFELMDMIGLDISFAVTRSVFAAYFNDPRFTPSLVQQELVNAGFLGRKSGRGFYRYDGGDMPAISTEAPQAAPHEIVFTGAGKMAESLAARLANAGLASKRAAGQDDALFTCGGATVCLTDGRSATQRARDTGNPNTVLLDLALDYASASRVALARADQCDATAYHAVVGALQAAAFQVSRLDDVPGMAVMRTVAMLANEAADAVNQGVCSMQAADVAMQKGVNYPRGPLAWADAIGVEYVMTVLDHLARTYGEDRYRVSPLIRRKVASGEPFHA